MKLTPRICPVCRKQFQPKREKQTYDSVKCRQKAWEANNPRVAKEVIAKRRQPITLEDLCPDNPAAVRLLARFIQAEANKLAVGRPNRVCSRPGCTRRVRHVRDRFCSRAHDMADYIEMLAERKARRREKAVARKIATA